MTPVQLSQISHDSYTNPTAQHATEVEPDTFSFGSTIVAALQAGRFTDGGATNIGWATSDDNGVSWESGFLSGLTTVAGGTNTRVTDPSVTYDAFHDVWLISSRSFGPNTEIVVNRASDGTSWGGPVTVAHAGVNGAGGDPDKDWIACDNTPTSPFYGHCYVEWDDSATGKLIKMSTSADGGLTWGPPKETADSATGIGGQPLVRPNGTVVVPTANARYSAIIAFRSTDGGSSWGSVHRVASIRHHNVVGRLRTAALPSAEIDGAGKAYVAWQDCRFRRRCRANDIVMSTSADGLNWSPVARVPIDGRRSSVDHFLPGIAVDRATAGADAHLALTYYYYPATRCSPSTCRLDVGFISSTDGGQHWRSPTFLGGPMKYSWLAKTSAGYMVGDYISTSFSGNGTAHPVFALARRPTGTTKREAIYTPRVGLAP